MSDNQPLLFEKKEFMSAAGKLLNWRLECDALSDDVIYQIAEICAPRISSFGETVGVPRGGLRIADAFRKFCTKGMGITLICDDVWTTGHSMRRTVRDHNMVLTSRGKEDLTWMGFVIFNRSTFVLPNNVWAMWNYGVLK